MKYFPKSTVKEGFATDNTFLTKNTGKIYNGPYIETNDGEYYAGVHNSPGEQLVVNNTLFYNNPSNPKRFNTLIGTRKYNIIKSNIKARLEKAKTPAVVKNPPTENDYLQGYYKRYFLRRINGNRYIEIDKKQQIN